MIDYTSELVSALNQILPAHYEMTLTAKTKTPCISYMELNNYSSDVGDTLGYSVITYQIKVWGHSHVDIQRYALEIDAALRPLGFKRVAAGELYDRETMMIQKIMTYEALASENY